MLDSYFLNSKEQIERNKEFAHRYGAPILFPYVRWFLHECEKSGIETVIFIARDGYVLKKIADRFIEQENKAIQTKYLYGSRKVWRIGYFMSSGFDVARFLEESYPNRIDDAGKLAKRFMIDEDEMMKFLPDYYREHTAGWSICDIYILQNYLNNDSFRAFLKKRHEEKGEKILGYLRQEMKGIDEKKTAFVESVGTGYTQYGMNLIMGKRVPYRTFYYYQHKRKQDIVFDSYVEDKTQSSILLELLCRSCEGQTRDYVCDKHMKWRPEFDDVEIKYMKEYGYDAYIDEIEKMAQLNITFSKEQERAAKEEFFEMSDKKMLEYIGDFPYGVTGAESRLCTFSPRLTLKEHIYMVRYGEFYTENREYTGAMIRYSRMREKKLERSFWNLCMKNRFLRILRNRNICSYEEKNWPDLTKIFPGLSGKKIVIYGAGKVGTYVVKRLLCCKEVTIVKWVDKRTLQSELYPISDVSSLNAEEFDYIILATVMCAVASEMKKVLMKAGIEEKKIVTQFKE